MPVSISEMEDGNVLSFEMSRKLFRSSYASLELQRQIHTAQNISPCSLVVPHSVAALKQNNDLFNFWLSAG